MELRQPEPVQQLRCQDEQRVARWMRLVLGDVEVLDAQREIDGVEILQRRREEREMEREKQCAEDSAGQPLGARHAGRSSSPSLRLPVR